MVREICSSGVNDPRLALCTRSTASDGVDGAWWPKTFELAVELPDLVAVLGSKIGPIRRVVYDPSGWPPTPSRIIVGGAALSVDPYPMVTSDAIYLIGTHSRDAVVFVVPPKSKRAAALRVLGTVADATGPMSAQVLRHLLGHFAQTPERQAQ